MKNNVLTVMKKECRRIFNDRNLFFTTVLLPGLIMFVMYWFMGNFMGDLFSVDEEYIYQVHAVNMPSSVAGLLSADELGMDIHNISYDQIDEIKQQISDRETDLLIIFPANFDELVATFDPHTATSPAPNIELWHNFTRTESNEANGIVMAILNSYHHALTHRFTINLPTDDYGGNFNLATDADMFGMIIGIVVPMLFILMIFTGAQALAPESIAGEKERGTLGSILVTPARRRDIALGKILGISVFALMSGAVSMFGALFGMLSMMGMESGGGIFEFYTFTDIALLLLVTLSTTLVFVSVLSLLSAYAKSVKQATGYSMPIMIIVMIVALGGMFFGGVPDGIALFFVPVLNSSLSITAIFSFDVNVINILTAVATNLAIATLVTFLMARLFNSERIVFDK
ncbi:MAG: ABC transporter permease subunit [Defluviitaleaceae bacterium]|nr:ABC transporter permease subunit [Defluviitaleaceae bacterium]